MKKNSSGARAGGRPGGDGRVRGRAGSGEGQEFRDGGSKLCRILELGGDIELRYREW